VQEQVPPPPRWWHKPGLMARTLPVVLLGVFLLMGGATAWYLGLWHDTPPELHGSVAHIYWNEQTSRVLFVIDRKVLVDSAVDDESEPVLLHRDPENDLPPAWPPYLHCDGERQTLYLFLRDAPGDEDSGRIAIRRLRGSLWEGEISDNRLFVGGRTPGIMQEALDRGAPLQPLLFSRQHVPTVINDQAEQLEITAEPVEQDSFGFSVRVQDEDQIQADTAMKTPGFQRETVQKRVAAWYPSDWDENRINEINDILATGLERQLRILDLENPPASHLVLHQGEDFFSHQPVGRVGEAFPQVKVLDASAPRTADPMRLRHKIGGLTSSYALMRHCATPEILPLWLRAGLPYLLAAGDADAAPVDAARAEKHTLHLLVPDLYNAVDLQDKPDHAVEELGRHMTAYLAASFGTEQVVEYAMQQRPRIYRDPWEQENTVTREFFQLSQEEILQDTFSRPTVLSRTHPAARAISDPAPLSDEALPLTGFSLDAGGQRAVAVAGHDSASLAVIEVASGDTVKTAPADPGTTEIAHPAWFPDGDKVIFTAHTDDGQKLQSLDPDDPESTGTVVTSDMAESPAQPAPSPCGNFLAFSAKVDGSPQIHRKNLSSGEITVLTDESGPVQWPRWCAGGQKLAFICRGGAPAEIDRLATFSPASGQIQYFDLSPFRVHELSRPQWIDHGEILVPVQRGGRTVASVDLSAGDLTLPGGAEWAVEEIAPLRTDDQYILSVRDPALAAEACPGPDASAFYRRLFTATLRELP